jgi:hypothetical protein
MAAYLADHPDVFMYRKELHYFGSDNPRSAAKLSLDEYLYLFRQAKLERYLCDASPSYLRSERAAKEIHEFNPAARILIMLRDPVDWMYSYYGMLRYAQREPIEDFAAALAAEPARQLGRNIPPGETSPRPFLYRQNCRFTEQVARYLNVFGRDQMLVVISEEFATDTRREFLRTLDFLGLPDDHRAEFPVVNSSNSRLRYPTVTRWIRHPGPASRKVARVLVPSRRLRLTAGGSLALRALAMNRVPATRPPLDPVLRQQLRCEFVAEQVELEQLLGRRLPWGAASTAS